MCPGGATEFAVEASERCNGRTQIQEKPDDGLAGLFGECQGQSAVRFREVEDPVKFRFRGLGLRQRIGR
jgi:hypothetical protein